MIRKCCKLLKVLEGPNGDEERQKYESERDGPDSHSGEKKNEQGRCKKRKYKQQEIYLKLDESVHKSIDMDANGETFK